MPWTMKVWGKSNIVAEIGKMYCRRGMALPSPCSFLRMPKIVCVRARSATGHSWTVSKACHQVASSYKSNLATSGSAWVMKYPSLDQFIKNNFNFDDGNAMEQSFDLIASCIDKIYSEDEVWATEDCTKKEIVELDSERKAAMVSNLLVVLCGEKEASPVVNAGTLYN